MLWCLSGTQWDSLVLTASSLALKTAPLRVDTWLCIDFQYAGTWRSRSQAPRRPAATNAQKSISLLIRAVFDEKLKFSEFHQRKEIGQDGKGSLGWRHACIKHPSPLWIYMTEHNASTAYVCSNHLGVRPAPPLLETVWWWQSCVCWCAHVWHCQRHILRNKSVQDSLVDSGDRLERLCCYSVIHIRSNMLDSPSNMLHTSSCFNKSSSYPISRGHLPECKPRGGLEDSVGEPINSNQIK